jgi:hypothetical protein
VAHYRQSPPPEIMIFGSSRALRGDRSHYPGAIANGKRPRLWRCAVFNMGINGATAQVMNLQLTRILSPEQLPKMIIVADGVRAFNSSRPDLTYQDIASSEGYLKLLTAVGDRFDFEGDDVEEAKQNLKHSPYLRDAINAVLLSYTQRGQMREALVQGYNQLVPLLNNTNRLIESKCTQPFRRNGRSRLYWGECDL